MKNFYTILLLMLITVQTVSLMLFFSIKQNVVKYKMQGLSKEQARQEQIRTYVFSLTQFETIKRDEGKEFSMDGWMYDITFSAVKNDSIYLFAFRDHEESKLLRRFADLFRKSQDKKGMSSSHTFIYSPSLPFAGTDISFKFELTEIANVFFAIDPTYISHSFLSSFFQPPEHSAHC